MQLFIYNVQFEYTSGYKHVYDAAVHYIKAPTQTDGFMAVIRKVQNLLRAAGHRDVKVSLVELLDKDI